MTISETLLLALSWFGSISPAESTRADEPGSLAALVEAANDRDTGHESRLRALLELVSRRRLHGLTTAILDLEAAPDPAIARTASWLHATARGELPATDLGDLEPLLAALSAPLRAAARPILLSEIGRAAVARGEPGIAARCADALDELAATGNDWRCEYEARMLRGMCALLANDQAAGRATLQSALDLALGREDALRGARARFELGRALFLIDDHPGAQAAYRSAIAVFETNEAYFDAVSALRHLAQSIVSSGDPSSAQEPCARALELAISHGWIAEELDARRLDALLRIATGDLDGAHRALTAYSERAREVESRSHEATAERDFAAIEFAQDRLEAARTRLRRALALSESIADPDGAAESHLRLATIASRLGDPIAMEFHAGAVIGDRPDEQLSPLDLHLLLQRAEARLQLGDHDLAREDLRRALTIAGERGQLDSISDGLRLRAKLHSDLGDPDAGLADALESARVGASLQDPNAIAAGRILAAQIRFDRGDDAGATADLDVAEPLVEASLGTFFANPDFAAHIQLVRCGIAFRAGGFDDAEAHAARAREIARENGYADIERQSILLSATIELERSRSARENDATAALRAAEERAEEALAHAERAAAPPLRLGPLSLLVEIALLRGDLEASRRRLDDALETLETIAGDEAAAAFGVEIASRARAGHAGLFALAQDLATAEIERERATNGEPASLRARIERSFTEVMRFSGRALVEGIVELRAGFRSREGAELRRRIAALDGEIDHALRRSAEALRAGDPDLALREREATTALRNDRAALVASLREAEPRRTSLLAPPPATPDSLRAAGCVGPTKAIVAYANGSGRTFAYVVTEADCAFVEIASGEVLARRVEAFLAEIARPESLGGPSAIAAEGRALSRMVLDPVLAIVGDRVTELVVIPNSQLSHVPFEALVLDDPPATGDPPDFARLSFAIDRLDVRYAPAASVLLELARAGTARDRSRACVFADSAGGLGLPALANAVSEGERVAARFAECVRRFDEHATTAALGEDLLGYSVIHFASHALAFAEPPLTPGLVLRNAQGEAEIFGIGEVLDLELDADLVVLSACSTNAGDVRPGEGIVSLARSFLFAGARCVIASLFPLSDAAALATVDDFYRRLEDSTHDPAAALLATKRAIRRGEIVIPSPSQSRGVGAVRAAPRGVPTGHPFHWAPLVVIGR